MVIIILCTICSVLATERQGMTEMKQAVLYQTETQCISAERYLWWDKRFPQIWRLSSASARTTTGTSVTTEAARVSKVCSVPAHLCKQALKGEEDFLSTIILTGWKLLFVTSEPVSSNKTFKYLTFQYISCHYLWSISHKSAAIRVFQVLPGWETMFCYFSNMAVPVSRYFSSLCVFMGCLESTKASFTIEFSATVEM